MYLAVHVRVQTVPDTVVQALVQALGSLQVPLVVEPLLTEASATQTPLVGTASPLARTVRSGVQRRRSPHGHAGFAVTLGVDVTLTIAVAIAVTVTVAITVAITVTVDFFVM